MFNLVHEAINQRLIPGAASALITKTGVLKDIYGLSEYPDIVLKENAVYDIASLTKLFTSERIFQLIDEGVIKLNDPIAKFLPSFKNKELTIELLMMHRSGFLASARGRYTLTKSELISSILNCEDLVNEPNKDMVYSCINFIILGMVIEALDRTPLDQSFKKYIFVPLGLNNTGFNPSDKAVCVPTELDKPRGVVNDETARKLGGIAGNAGLFSTLDDLILFTQYTMKHRYKMLEGYNVLSRSLGWNRFKDETLFHTGFTGPIIIMLKDRALIILTNRIHPSREDTGYLAYRESIMNEFSKKPISSL